MEETFKSRVRQALVLGASLYKENFLDCIYYVFSSNFKIKDFYKIEAKEDNYKHLTGVSSSLSPTLFFQKCLNNSLTEQDFEIQTKVQKGSVRRKIKVLLDGMILLNGEEILVEENFKKNTISCSFASSDNKCTIGFTSTESAKPQTLLSGNQLKNPIEIDVIIKKSENKIEVIHHKKV